MALLSYWHQLMSLSDCLSVSLFCRKNSRLQLNRVRVEDAGEYTCEAENVLGRDTVKGTISVKSGKLRVIDRVEPKLFNFGYYYFFTMWNP